MARRLHMHAGMDGGTEDRAIELLFHRWMRLINSTADVERPRPVLVVEDDDAVRALLTEALEGEGFETVGAADGDEACRVAGDVAPQAVVLDIGLPSLDGDEFVRRWREATRAAEIPVVVVSGRADAETVADEIGAQGVLRKPVDVKRFVTLVHQVTDPPSIDR